MELLRVEDLKVHFPVKGGILGRTVDHVRAVDGVSFHINPGEIYGLVGESGSGKSTTGNAIVGLVKMTDGSITFEGKDITEGVAKNRSSYREDVQVIFQDAYSSMNTRKRVLDIIAEPIRNFQKMPKEEERQYVQELLSIVGMPAETAIKYPYQFSGGQRQRICVARALALKPKLIIADEPVSALDLSIQAQILNYIKQIQKQYNIAFLFISHDLSVIRHMCDRLAVMHRGRFVEEGSMENIYTNPQHIYTKKLIAAIPNMDPDMRESNEEKRKEIEIEYSERHHEYYKDDRTVYDMVEIAKDHRVALPPDMIKNGKAAVKEFAER